MAAARSERGETTKNYAGKEIPRDNVGQVCPPSQRGILTSSPRRQVVLDSQKGYVISKLSAKDGVTENLYAEGKNNVKGKEVIEQNPNLAKFGELPVIPPPPKELIQIGNTVAPPAISPPSKEIIQNQNAVNRVEENKANYVEEFINGNSDSLSDSLQDFPEFVIMEGYSNHTHRSSQEMEVLDVKPLRTIAPMRPSSLGLDSYAPPSTGDSPFVFVTPSGSFASASDSLFRPNFVPLFPNLASPQPSNQKPVFATPLNSRSANGSASTSGRKSKVGSSDAKSTGEKKEKPPKKPRKVYGRHDTGGLLPSSHDARESVEVILMTFDALRRRVQQIDG
ncbi:uncharacterized protein A4U43_UnF1240 [Asparagus officinalis]|uniref:Uncharacterized protein n=1 Tax=Asparagus officinalis TaxID=4686 RepID=A0A1R3L7M8_ASPOF|nr:uncharacterized protein A4U43_UnF1240 [Asparagus officinalis]